MSFDIKAINNRVGVSVSVAFQHCESKSHIFVSRCDEEITKTKDTMIISVNTHDALFQNVLELNNLGVDLMEANAFQSAGAALREAILIIKDVIQPVQGDPSYAQSLSRSNTVVFECTKRLLEVKSSFSSTSGALYGLGIPLRMLENNSQTEVSEAHNPGIATAVLLFNFGLLNRWTGSQCKGRTSHQLKETALRLLASSHHVLSSRTCMVQAEVGDITDVRLFLLIQVLKLLSQIEGELGKHADAEAHMEQLETLATVAFFKVNFGSAIHLPAAPAA